MTKYRYKGIDSAKPYEYEINCLFNKFNSYLIDLNLYKLFEMYEMLSFTVLTTAFANFNSHSIYCEKAMAFYFNLMHFYRKEFDALKK